MISKIKYLYNHSIYLSNSYYERFSKDLKLFILSGEKIKGKFIMDDLNSVLKRLSMIFFYPFGRKNQTEPGKIEHKFQNMLKNFDNTIDDLLKNMEKDLLYKEENDFSSSLKNCLKNLKETLDEQKKLINKNLKEKDIKTKFDKKTNNIKDTFKKVANNFSRISDNYYNKIIKIYKKKLDFFSQYFEEEYLKKLENLFKNINYKTFRYFLKKSLDAFNTNKILESALEDIINEILEGVKECTYYKNSKSLFDWLYLQISNTEYLSRNIEYMYDNSEKKFNNFIENVDTISF